MIKTLLIASLLTVSIVSITPAKAADNSAKRVCEYISVNDKTRLRSFLKQKKMKIRNMYKAIQCNGQNILIFAAKSKALDTGEFIIGKLPKKVVAADLADIEKYSAHLAEDARDRIE